MKCEESEDYQKTEENYRIIAEAYKGIISGFLSPNINNIETLEDAISGLLSSIQVPEKYIDLQQEIRVSEQLTIEEFENRYGQELKQSRYLGRNGWVISEHANPKYVKEWSEEIVKGEKQISVFFEKNNENVIRNIRKNLGNMYVQNPFLLYYSKAMQAYDNEDYMTSAMYLVSLLEFRISKMVSFPSEIKRNRKKYSDKGFGEKKKTMFDNISKNNSFFSKRFYYLNMYPSLIEYLNRMFYEGAYSFIKEKEPPYLNRNWLLHGRMSRAVERYECIQVLNALSVAEFALK